MTIEAQDVPRLIKEAFPEFSSQVDQHIADWPDDPMIYLIVGSLFQFVADMPQGSDRISAASRMYALTEKMLEDGSKQVETCFAIEMIEPLVSTSHEEYYPNFEASLGVRGKRELAAWREWSVQYTAMNDLMNDLNRNFGAPVFEAVGIGDGTVRFIARSSLWRLAGEARRNSMFGEIQRKWFDLTGHRDGVEITEPATNAFRILRDS